MVVSDVKVEEVVNRITKVATELHFSGDWSSISGMKVSAKVINWGTWMTTKRSSPQSLQRWTKIFSIRYDFMGEMRRLQIMYGPSRGNSWYDMRPQTGKNKPLEKTVNQSRWARESEMYRPLNKPLILEWSKQKYVHFSPGIYFQKLFQFLPWHNSRSQ